MTTTDLYGFDIDEDEEIDTGAELRLENSEAAAESLRRYRYWERRAAELSAPFEAEMDRLRARWDEVLKPIRRKLDWHHDGLEQYHRAAFAAKTAQPTLKLPAGDTLLRKAKPTLSIDDEAELLAWAAGEGLDVLADPKLSKAKLGEVIKVVEIDGAEPGTPLQVVRVGTGEVVPGLSAVTSARNFSIVQEGRK
jgi:hypothetical protein